MGLLRLLFFGAIIYLLYRWLFPRQRPLDRSSRSSGVRSKPSIASDVLVEDPHCHTYIPKRSAITASIGDETLYFCSDKCYEAYFSKKGAGK